MSELDDLFRQTEDQPIPGGCDRCEAFQTVDSPTPGVHIIHVHHDDWCPFLRERETKPTPTWDELVGPRVERDYSDEEF